MASASPSQKSLLRDRRGASTYIQALILVSLVALGGLAAFKALGSTTSNSADCVGKRVGALAPVECRNTGGEQLPASVAEPPAAPEPDQSDSQPGAEEIDPLEELKKLALDILGVTDAVDCFTKGDIMACVMTALQLSPIKAIGVGIKLAKNAKRIKELVDRVLAARKAKKADEVADAGGKCRGGKCDKPGVCFAPGTLVHTASGTVPIEELAPGDLVLSRDDQTGEEAYRPIAQTFVTPDQPLLAVSLEDSFGALETFEVTAPHPFHVEGRGWVAAGDLAPGDVIVSSGGGRLRVASNQDTSRRTTVYNFEVEDFHTYFVGESAAWVHNDCVTTESHIKNSPFAKRQAEQMGEAAQRDVDSLLNELRKGNRNPGSGSRALGNGYIELRGRNGGRVIVRQTGDNTYDIIGKFQGHRRGDTANSRVINRLIRDYEANANP
jgi:Pretoxin HINT domain